MSAKHVEAPASLKIIPRVKVWLEIEGEYVFGYGISQILKAIDAEGSIKQAAVSLGRSYRHVWDRVKQAEKSLGRALVLTHVGGKDSRRSELTPAARELLANFLALREQMLAAVEREFLPPAGLLPE